MAEVANYEPPFTNNRLRVWIITIGEPLPIECGHFDRLLRSGNLAQVLASKGHDVVWWTSTFDHSRKRHYYPQDTDVEIGPHLSLRLLHGCGYKNNLSFMRIRDHRQIAKKFSVRARLDQCVPDIVLASLPTVELSLEAVRYCRERGIPSVLDMRDMWPDIFTAAVPKILRPFVKIMSIPMLNDARAACSEASAITGITEEFVAWGLNKAGRPRTDIDRSFPLAYVSSAPTAEQIRSAENYWDGQGIRAEDAQRTVCFMGALSRQFDIETVIHAARECSRQGLPWRFVICGAGDRLEQYRRMAQDLSNVLLPGWVDRAQIYVLMRRSAAGLDPMPDRYDFLATINNKAIEYMSAGLPVISCPRKGVLAETLASEKCGLSYDYDDAQGLLNLLTNLTPSKLEQLSANAGRLFRERFTAERVYGEMAQYLNEVARAHNSAAI